MTATTVGRKLPKDFLEQDKTMAQKRAYLVKVYNIPKGVGCEY